MPPDPSNDHDATARTRRTIHRAAQPSMTLGLLLTVNPPHVLQPLVQRWANAQRTDLLGRLAHQRDRWREAQPRWARAWRHSPALRWWYALGNPALNDALEQTEDLLNVLRPLEQRPNIPREAADKVPDLLLRLLANPFLHKDPDHPGWAPILKHLTDHGARVDAQDPGRLPVLYLALLQGCHGMLDHLPMALIRPHLTTATPTGDTVAHLGAQMGPSALVQRFLDDGLDPEVLDERGNTLLNRAVQGQQLGNVQVLLNAGASLTEPNLQGTTPLTRAAAGIQIATMRGEPVQTTRAQAVQRLLVERHVALERTALLGALDERPIPGDPPRPTVQGLASTRPARFNRPPNPDEPVPSSPAADAARPTDPAAVPAPRGRARNRL